MSKTDHGTTDVVVGSEIYTLNFNLKAVRSIERFLVVSALPWRNCRSSAWPLPPG